MVILTALKDKEAWMSLIVLDLTSSYTSCQRELEYVPIHIRNDNFSDPFFIGSWRKSLRVLNLSCCYSETNLKADG